jgi:hypothetical protein
MTTNLTDQDRVDLAPFVRDATFSLAEDARAFEASG